MPVGGIDADYSFGSKSENGSAYNGQLGNVASDISTGLYVMGYRGGKTDSGKDSVPYD